MADTMPWEDYQGQSQQSQQQTMPWEDYGGSSAPSQPPPAAPPSMMPNGQSAAGLDASQIDAARRAYAPPDEGPIYNGIDRVGNLADKAMRFGLSIPNQIGDQLQSWALAPPQRAPLAQIPSGISTAGLSLSQLRALQLGYTSPGGLGASPVVAATIGTLPTLGASLLPGLGEYSAPEDLLAAPPGSNQSIGAAAATPNISSASPAIQSAIRTAAQKNGGAINAEALARHVEADSLPVPVRLTEGQATQDPQLLSLEQNSRGEEPEIAGRFNEQNGQLVQNLQSVRDQVGPDVFSGNAVEHGDTLIDAYKAKDTAAQADIRAKYQALKEANGGDFPVDGQSFVQNADAALKANMKAPFLPSGIQSVLSGFRDGEPMTFENFENLRTTLAAASRTAERSGDGNAAAAVGLVRSQLESLPMSGESANVRVLANQARAAAKARFDALRADPAYNAAVNDTVPADRFVQRFIMGAPRDDVATMRTNLAGNDAAQQTMGVAALDHLRRVSGIDDLGNGNFSQAAFNKNIQALQPKFRSLFDPQTADTLNSLGNVARYTQFQPRGSFVNNSNTLVAGLADKAKGLAEHGTNMAFGGIPVGTMSRKLLERVSAHRSVKQTLAPGAGIDRIDLR